MTDARAASKAGSVPAAGTADSVPDEPFRLTSSPGFIEWLGNQRASIALTTYQAGKIFLIGTSGDGQLTVFERTFPRCMGLAVSQDSRCLLLVTRHQIVRFDNALSPTECWHGHDALYVPHASWTTGDVDAHDVGFGRDARPVFANTLFSCVSAVADGHSFRPIWRPPFISRLAPEDRCHLNGVAFREGGPTHVTMAARTDTAQGWREHRAHGGHLVCMDSGSSVLTGLSMPHSPRWQAGAATERLWLLNSGRGELGYLDRGRFVPVAFCPGYARGLAFVGPYALVGLSLGRESAERAMPSFSGLPLAKALADRGLEASCGVEVIDTRTGETAGWLRIDGLVRELFDVAVLHGVLRPGLVGFRGKEIDEIVSIAPY